MDKNYKTSVVFRGWRNNMWVMTPDGIGIMFNLAEYSSIVHIVDKEDGLTTIAEMSYPTQALRQAKFEEIPSKRRNFSPGQAERLGYM